MSNSEQLSCKDCHNLEISKFFICLVWCPEQNKRIAPLSLFRGCRKRVIAFTPQIDCDQTAMGLPPITSAVLLIAK
jgi:hypothetical protein